jgi:hypothetical protein
LTSVPASKHALLEVPGPISGWTKPLARTSDASHHSSRCITVHQFYSEPFHHRVAPPSLRLFSLFAVEPSMPTNAPLHHPRPAEALHPMASVARHSEPSAWTSNRRRLGAFACPPSSNHLVLRPWTLPPSATKLVGRNYRPRSIAPPFFRLPPDFPKLQTPNSIHGLFHLIVANLAVVLALAPPEAIAIAVPQPQNLSTTSPTPSSFTLTPCSPKHTSCHLLLLSTSAASSIESSTIALTSYSQASQSRDLIHNVFVADPASSLQLAILQGYG